MSRGTATISDKWIKASIIGTIWAAAEIVLGSFLHNLRVPFSGNLLTAIALVILISVSFKWREHGLYWRAGLICALMKAMSPSAIIFGPMIAIIMESLLLEASVRLFGRTFFGFIIGSMLAMSWNLFQKIFNMIIFYGGNLIDIYSSITAYASKQLNLQFDAFWAPLVLLLAIYALFGAVTAVVGIITGRRISSLPPEESLPEPAVIRTPDRQSGDSFGYSLAWLAADLILVAGMLLVVGLLPWIWWIIVVIPVVTILAMRYKRAMRQLSKPGFWITFVIITMLSALAFTAFQPGKHDLHGAILIGVQMNFRAVIIIVGFSALGTELYNQKIRSLFSRTRLRQLPLALEMSAASLPTMIADMPDLRTALKKPVSILNRMITRVERRLNEERRRPRSKKKVFIVTGTIGEGKTSWLAKLSGLLKEKGVRVGGILGLRIVEEERTTGYDVSDISTGARAPFLRYTGSETMGVDRFTVDDAGYEAGKNALHPETNHDKDVVILDEVGPLELRGLGWSERLVWILNEPGAILIIAVRKNLTEEVTDKFGITGARVIDVASGNVLSYADEIASLTVENLRNEGDT
ncbi:MAG: nucleoside-triphosphatase [Bacteroidales bacterium]|nr:nucleoside-triphosphatase [Bacteroidales bacterium]